MLVAAAKTTDSGLMVAAGVTDYMIGPPIVHWAHGHVATGFGSLGLRTLPILLGGAVIAGGSKGDIENALVGVWVVGIGAVAAVTIDAAVLAREEVPVTTAFGVPLFIAPRTTLMRRGGTVGLTGAF
jgi:hypothetical protein